MSLPKKIQHKKTSNHLELVWKNGEVSQLSGDKLRQFCACSKCRARDVVGQQLIGDDGEISKLQLMGSTGMQIVFADGHDRGIFPWGYLRAIADDVALNYLHQSHN